MGEKLKEASQTVFENTTNNSYGRPWTWHFVFAHILIHWTSSLSQSVESLYFFGSLDEIHSIHCIIKFWYMSCFCCCASMFKGSIFLESQLSQIYYFNTHVSSCSFDLPITSLWLFCVIDGGYIKALLRQVFSSRLQHIIRELDLDIS